jgi:ribosomal protein S18 acetylase RimI-like enzyme
VNVRETTPADERTILAFVDAIVEERWNRPWTPPEFTAAELEGKLVLVAEDDGEVIGFAYGQVFPNGLAHLNIAYVRPENRRQGVAKALTAAFAAGARERGAEHVSLDVDLSNEVGRRVWQRLGFVEWARRLQAPVEVVEARAAGARGGESYASLHVQTDDAEAVEAAVAKYLPRLGGPGGRVEGPRNGWVAVYADLVDRDRRARERLASELSNATAAVVCAIGVEDGAVVRYVLFERGSVVDEYQSLPEHFGPLPPGDVVALGANPTVVSRLTGADPARFRAVARTASSADELPPADELLRQIASLMGLEGAGHG